MLFNSYGFILLFLPITLLGFFWIGRLGHRPAMAWLVAASLFFYGWWNPAYLGLLVASILFNYAIGTALSARPNRLLLGGGIAFNLGLLGYYKYANFFIDNINAVLDLGWNFEAIILPLAISFFTFQQIAYLIDAHRGETREYNFLHYCLFVTFFPQLIAGPIVHHREMMPQFARKGALRPNYETIALGLTVFTIGLFKKVAIADTLAKYANMAFDAAGEGMALTFFEAWRGATAYSFQLYFDFSGYSDMAIGLGLLFGITLPLNFNSPYRARSVVDFWRRWHMTLSRFLRDYVYIPLGGNRKGRVRRHANLFVTMLLGGLWHGAAWTFVLWGALHGLYLMVNHAWASMRARLGWSREATTSWGRALAWTLTFIAVVFAWVFFRAHSFEEALLISRGMLGMNGFAWPGTVEEFGWAGQLLSEAGWRFEPLGNFKGAGDLVLLGLFVLIALKVPNTQQLVAARHRPLNPYGDETVVARRSWQPSPRWAAVTGVVALFTLLQLSRVSEFLYFQF